MGRRFSYRRLTPEQFAAALRQHDLAPEAFARLYGVGTGRVQKWIEGSMEIPHPVAVVLTLLTLPGAYSLIRRLAREMIEADREEKR